MARSDTDTASDVAVGDDGSVWITCSPKMKESGIHVMYYDFSTEKFIKSRGMGLEIAVTSTGEPLMALENGELILKREGELIKLNGYARDLSVTKQDDVWIVSSEKIVGGYEVYKGKLG